MQTLKRTPFELVHLPVHVRSGELVRLVVVKATFTIVPDGVCTVAPTQRFPSGARHYEDDVEQSLSYPDDLVPFKPRGECFVLGAFHAPGGRPVRVGKVAFRVGAAKKEVAVFGKRRWGLLGPSDPEEMVTVPLRWENAFGGPSAAENPIGAGGDEVPRLELAHDLLLSPTDRRTPAGTGPIAPTWAPRAQQAGTYDAMWATHSYPHLPADLDWSFFCSAPADQQVEGYWRGDEEIALLGLDPERPRIDCRLPAIRPRVGWVFAEGATGTHVREVPLALDTLVIDAEASEVVAVWRGSTAPPEGASHVVATHEAPGERSSLTRTAHELLEAQTPADDEPMPPKPSPVELVREPSLSAAASRQARRAGPGSPPPLGASLAAAVAPALASGLTHPEAPAAPAIDGEELAALERKANAARRSRVRARSARVELERAARRGTSCKGMDLREADLSGLDLRSVDLTEADLTGALLNGARLVGVCLDGARLDGAQLGGARFVNTSMLESSLVGASGEAAYFEGVNLRGAVLDGAELPRARFRGVGASGAQLQGASLLEASFEECNLEGIRAGAAILAGSSFTATRLSDAHLAQGCVMRQVRFDECDLRGLRAFEAEAQGLFVRRCRAEKARLSQSSLEGAAFHEVPLVRADFTEAKLDGVRFAKSTLRFARFDRASLRGAVLLGADLFQARLEGADLSDADLRGASLYQAELLDACLEGARLDLANLAGTRMAPR